MDNTQLSLDLIPGGTRKVIETGESLRDKGIKKAIDHANKVSDQWAENAYRLLLEYIRTHSEFLAEDFRKWSEDRLIQPPHKRAFGGIFYKARKNNLIKRVDCIPVKNPLAHKCLATLWRTV